MSNITVDRLRAAIAKIAVQMAISADELNTADGKLGDGDIGITMNTGMKGLAKIADDLPDDDLGMAFLACAKEFTRVSGSSYGTLLATGLMSAAKALKGKRKADWSEVSSLIGGAIEAMMKRGKGALGDKTVLDMLEAMRIATDGVDDPDEILKACDKAASETMENFRDKPSKLGRARMYGDKSIGLDDPGMLALRRVIDGLV